MSHRACRIESTGELFMKTKDEGSEMIGLCHVNIAALEHLAGQHRRGRAKTASLRNGPLHESALFSGRYSACLTV